MEALNLEQFLARLSIARAPGLDLLSPAQASLLQLRIAELVIDHRVELALLKFLSRFLTPQLYDELIEEKNIEHQCGYLVCGQLPKQQVRRRSSGGAHEQVFQTQTQFRIYNRKPSMILPTTYLSQYCCKNHYQASLFYRNQLSAESLISRKGILDAAPFPPELPTWYENNITCLEEVLAKHRELRDQGKTLGEVISMMNGLLVADGDRDGETAELVKLIEDFEIVENANPEFCEPEYGVPGDPSDVYTASRGVEGHYTSERRHGKHPAGA